MREVLSSGRTVGFDGSGVGVPVILLHAFPLCRQLFLPQLSGLCSQARLIAPDLAGFGETSPFSDVPSMESMADDVAELIERILPSGERVVLLGMSMGGYVCLAFARKYPEKLRGLILADTRAEADDAATRAKREERIEYLQSHSPSEFIEVMLPGLVGQTTHESRPDVLARVRYLAGQQTSTGVANALRALRDRPDSTPYLSAIQVPTLVIVGDEDTITPPAVAETLARGIRGASLCVVHHAGHLSCIEKPAEFNAAVGVFLRQVTG